MSFPQSLSFLSVVLCKFTSTCVSLKIDLPILFYYFLRFEIFVVIAAAIDAVAKVALV